MAQIVDIKVIPYNTSGKEVNIYATYTLFMFLYVFDT